jgi:hypothetical protein
LAINDLILTEVLQGFRNDERDFNDARKMLTALTVVELSGEEIAIQAVNNFRALRKLGVTVRKTIDAVIATPCIERYDSGYDLLHNDRDFDPGKGFALACATGNSSNLAHLRPFHPRFLDRRSCLVRCEESNEPFGCFRILRTLLSQRRRTPGRTEARRESCRRNRRLGRARFR